MRRIRQIYKLLPDEVKQRVLTLIEEAAATRPSFTFLRLDATLPCGDELLRSHIGGTPYAEARDEWPTRPRALFFTSPAKFLIQVRMEEPSLGEQWQGRLLTVYFWLHPELAVRSYATPSPERYVPLHAPITPLPCVHLVPTRMPIHPHPDGEEEGFYVSSAGLCNLLPTIPRILHPYTDDYVGLLTQVLCPNASFHDFTPSAVAYVGGQPIPIQEPHEPRCDVCYKQLRFLFQFGDIVPGLQLGDAGVCYIYGCDDHPTCCKGFYDSH